MNTRSSNKDGRSSDPTLLEENVKAADKVESSDEEEEMFEPCRQKFDSEIEIDPLDSLEDKITKLILRQEKKRQIS